MPGKYHWEPCALHSRAFVKEGIPLQVGERSLRGEGESPQSPPLKNRSPPWNLSPGETPKKNDQMLPIFYFPSKGLRRDFFCKRLPHCICLHMFYSLTYIKKNHRSKVSKSAFHCCCVALRDSPEVPHGAGISPNKGARPAPSQRLR
jgi:hypothetical protein